MTSNFKIYFIFFILMQILSFSYAKTDLELEATIKAVAQGFKMKNNQQIQKYIHTKYGYIEWYRIGIPTIQTFVKKTDFAFPLENSQPP